LLRFGNVCYRLYYHHMDMLHSKQIIIKTVDSQHTVEHATF
jgi:hypothetical protein